MLNRARKPLTILKIELENIKIKREELNEEYKIYMLNRARKPLAILKIELENIKIKREELNEEYNQFLCAESDEAEDGEQFLEEKSAQTDEDTDNSDPWGDIPSAPAVNASLKEEIRQQKIQQFEKDLAELKKSHDEKEKEIEILQNELSQIALKHAILFELSTEHKSLTARLKYASELVHDQFSKESKERHALSEDVLLKIFSLMKQGLEMDLLQSQSLQNYAWPYTDLTGKLLSLFSGDMSQTLVVKLQELQTLHQKNCDERERIVVSQARQAEEALKRLEQADKDLAEIAVLLSMPGHQLSSDHAKRFVSAMEALGGFAHRRDAFLQHVMDRDLIQCPQILEILLSPASDLSHCVKDARPFINMLLILTPILQEKKLEQDVTLNRLVALGNATDSEHHHAQINRLHVKIKGQPCQLWKTTGSLASVVFFAKKPAKPFPMDLAERTKMAEKFRSSGISHAQFTVNEKKAEDYLRGRSYPLDLQYCAILHESIARVAGKTDEVIKSLTGVSVSPDTQAEINLSFHQDNPPVVTLSCDCSVLASHFGKKAAVTTDEKSTPVKQEQMSAFELYHYLTAREQDSSNPVWFQMYGEKLLINLYLYSFHEASVAIADASLEVKRFTKC